MQINTDEQILSSHNACFFSKPNKPSKSHQLHNTRFRYDKLHGFALVELLVVMAIISVLAAFLLPVLGRAMEMARRTMCMNNVKQQHVGIVLYGGDYNQHLPGRPTTNNSSRAIMFCGAYHRLWPDYVVDTDVFFCPGLRHKKKPFQWDEEYLRTTIPSAPNGWVANIGYFWAFDGQHMERGNDNRPYGRLLRWSHPWIFPRIETSYSPTEQPGIFHTMGHDGKNGYPAGGTILMPDGHVEWLRYRYSSDWSHKYYKNVGAYRRCVGILVPLTEWGGFPGTDD